MLLRPATEKDLEAIRLIYEDAILNTTAVYEDLPFTQAYMHTWWTEKQKQQFPVLVLETNDMVAGFCTYGHFRMRSLYFPCKEHSVYVHPDFRGRGYGHTLLKGIIEEATQKGVHTIIGGIDAENALSIALHEKHGFTQVAHLKEVAFKFGRYLDLVLMQKILKPAVKH